MTSIIGSAAMAKPNSNPPSVAACQEACGKYWQEEYRRCNGITECVAYVRNQGDYCVAHCFAK